MDFFKSFSKTVSPKTPASSNSSPELAHITEEMYKKNAELADRNKTLSLLRKIDQIILGALTDTKEIAQQVANLVATEAELKEITIYLYHTEKQILEKLAVSHTPSIKQEENKIHHSLHPDEIPMNDSVNILVRSIVNADRQITHDFFDLVVPYISREESLKIQQDVGIKSTLVYPLIVRDEVIGSMSVSIGEDEGALSPFKKDLIERLVGVVGIAIDSALLYQHIQEANKRLKQLDKLKDEFVSLASHELRTPMTVIKSYLWSLLAGKKGEVPADQRVYLERAYSSVERLIAMVNDMLNVSRIESGRLTIDIQPTDLLEVTTSTIQEMQPRAQDGNITLAVASTEENLPHVLADDDKIKQVLINLIGNSLKFTPEGGKITINLKRQDDMVLVSVIDTGKGIKQEDISKLFQKFHMVGDNFRTKLTTQGTGLGLYLSKAIIERQGGKIWTESEGEGKGSTFSFTLPIVKR